MEEPIKLVTTQSDVDYAEDLKNRLLAAYEPVCVLLDEAQANHFMINVNVAPNGWNKHVVATLVIGRRYVP